MLVPLLVTALGFALLFAWLLLRMRTALNERKARAVRFYGMAELAAWTANSRSRPAGRRGAEAVMNALSAYFGMGGYAAFVWPAYAITAAVLGGLAVHSWRRYRASVDALARLQSPSRNRE
jgi:heme exporter protein D